MGQRNVAPGAPESATEAEVTARAPDMFNGGARVEKARPNGEPKSEPGVPSWLAKRYKRIATHEQPIHLDEYMAIDLIRRFPLEAETLWPGVTGAEFRPLDGSRDDFLASRDDPTVLKLGWGGFQGQQRDHAVDEHVLPDEERRSHCTATLVAELMNLSPIDRVLIGPLLKEVREGDKQGKQPSSLMHLATVVMAPLSEGETYEDVLKVVTWAVNRQLGKQHRFIEAAEQLMPSDVWHLPWKNGQVEVHAFNYVDSGDLERFKDVAGAVSHKRGAKLVVIRSAGGNTSILDDLEKQLPMTSIAVAIRATECHKRSRPIPPLVELQRRGTIPGAPEWHFADSGDLLNGSRNPAATLIQLNELKNVLAHALDANWMKTNGFVA